ncbi:MAG: hypothetical protein MJ078_08515, partial [Clostridia bacterium]|nr:hypothetical protein [Clostridia bacterium]
MQASETKTKKRLTESRVFLAVLLSFFILLQMTLYKISAESGWYVRLTDPQYYTLSGALDGYFDLINPLEENVTVTFCQSENDLASNNTYGRILDTVRQFEKRYSFFRTEFYVWIRLCGITD